MTPVSPRFWQNSEISRRLARPESALIIVFLALAVVLSFYFCWLVRIFSSPYLPSSLASDGIGYYLSSKSFFINKTLSAPLIHLDKVSAIGDFYSHGFAYPLLNGTAGIIFGWNDRIIIVVNLALAAVAALILLFLRDKFRVGLLLLVLATFYITPTMTLSYMQETIHILFAVGASLLFLRAAAANEPLRWQAVATFYAVLILAALFRPLWLLWSVALPALGRTKKEHGIHLGLAAAGILLSLVFMKLFYAPYPYYSPQDEIISALRAHGVFGAASVTIKTVWQNITKLTADEFYIFGKTRLPNIYTLVIIILNFYFLYRFRKSDNRVFLAGFLIGTAYIGAIFFLYDTLAGARQLAAVFAMQMVFLTYAGPTSLVAAIAVLQLILFPMVVTMTNHVLEFQLEAGLHARRNSHKLAELQRIGEAIHEGRRTTIYVDPKLSNAKYPLIVHYPLQGADRYPIRYSLDIFASGPLGEHAFDRSFIDYVLSADPVEQQDLQPVYTSKSFYLYRLR
jgi:hypothetical protein